MSATPFFYLLVEDNTTSTFATTPPPWGRPLEGLPDAGGFHMTDWHDLAHVLTWRLASHPSRTLDARSATCCVVKSPAAGGYQQTAAAQRKEAGQSGCNPRAGDAVARRLEALGARVCPGRPLVVIDGPDADGSGTALCSSLWGKASCARGLNDPIVRVTGNAPGLQSEVATRGSRGLCRRLPAVPYLAHARTALAALPEARPRPLRIAYAAASWGHVDAEAHGFVAWRKALRNACKALKNASACEWTWISMSGHGAEEALRAYQNAAFCLQPPGDTLPRPGIIDALSVGCVPVLFHPGQRTLWPAHWDGGAAVGLDWADGAARPRGRDHRAYAARANGALASLLSMPAAQLREVQAKVHSAAARLVYADGASQPQQPPQTDAVDVLVDQMRRVHLKADAAEAAAYATQLKARTAMIEAQRSFEQRRKQARGAT